nr:tRNA(Ile)-lysidine synthase [Boldiaceae sp.]
MLKKASFIHQKFLNCLRFQIKLPKDITILVAISGGQDSMCLLKLLKDYKKNHNWSIHVIHFNHKWRQDSIKNSQAIKKLGLKWNLKFHLYEQYIHKESDAREWRYSELIKLAYKYNTNYVLTAHTIDDKIETTLYNIIQGTGFDGITSLNYTNRIFRKIKLIHPLLCLTRDETLWFCKNFCLPIWSDTTNYIYNIKRNRIRQELIPYFNKYFNNKFKQNFVYFLHIIAKEVEYLQKKTKYFYTICRHPRFIAINKPLLKNLSIVIQRRIIRVFMYTNTKLKLDFKNTESIIKILTLNENHIMSKQINRNWYLLFNNKWLYLTKK